MLTGITTSFSERLWDVANEDILFDRTNSLDYDNFDDYKYLIKFSLADRMME